MVNGDDAVGANAYGGEIFHLERTAYEAYGETARGGAAVSRLGAFATEDSAGLP